MFQSLSIPSTLAFLRSFSLCFKTVSYFYSIFRLKTINSWKFPFEIFSQSADVTKYTTRTANGLHRLVFKFPSTNFNLCKISRKREMEAFLFRQIGGFKCESSWIIEHEWDILEIPSRIIWRTSPLYTVKCDAIIIILMNAVWKCGETFSRICMCK